MPKKTVGAGHRASPGPIPNVGSGLRAGPGPFVRKILLPIFLCAILICGMYLALQWLKRSWYIPIQVVSITNKVQFADQEAIKDAVTRHVKQGFFALNIAQIRNDLQKVAWIAEANVQRCWPDEVKIKIIERQPLAIWQGKGVIDTEGKLFFPSKFENTGGLPEFTGAIESVDAMVDTYLLILAALKPIGLSVSKIEIMPDQGWRAMLDNGITLVLGQVELEERLRRFVLAYHKFSDRQVTVVDMRYTNGLSVA